MALRLLVWVPGGLVVPLTERETMGRGTCFEGAYSSPFRCLLDVQVAQTS